MTLNEQAEKIIEKMNEVGSKITFKSEKQEKYYNDLLKDWQEQRLIGYIEDFEDDEFSDVFESVAGIDADEFEKDLEEWDLESAFRMIELAFANASDAIDFMKSEFVF